MRTPGPAFDLRAALSEELRAALDELEAVAAGVTQAAHRCRVRVKRARALARVGRSCAPGLSAVFVDSARGLMRNLALTRDPVALSDAARAAKTKAGRRTSSAFDAVAQAIDMKAATHAGANIEAARAGLKDLLALAQVWPEASHRQIRRGARRLDRRAKRARRRGAGSVDPSARHEWRKREKDRLFATELLGEAWPGRRQRKTAREIGEALGGERDALLLMERLVAEPDLASEDKKLRRALRTLNARRAKLARRADKCAARMRKS